MEWLLVVAGVVTPGFADLADCHKVGTAAFEQRVSKQEREAGKACTERSDDGLVHRAFRPGVPASSHDWCAPPKGGWTKYQWSGVEQAEKQAHCRKVYAEKGRPSVTHFSGRPASCGVVTFTYHCISRKQKAD